MPRTVLIWARPRVSFMMRSGRCRSGQLSFSLVKAKVKLGKPGGEEKDQAEEAQDKEAPGIGAQAQPERGRIGAEEG